MDGDDLREEFPKLTTILGAYLNQDYTICGPTLDDAVKAYISETTTNGIITARAEIARFLDVKANDLDAELDRLDNEYSREPGMDARAFLVWLDDGTRLSGC